MVRSGAYVNSITSEDANVQSSRFRVSIYYDIKTFHIVARASCTSPLKPFHTIYHTQYIHSCLFELPFGKALYLHVRRVLSRLKVCQRHGLTRFAYNALNAQYSDAFKNIAHWKRNFGQFWKLRH